jgi:hypothetical protein
MGKFRPEVPPRGVTLADVAAMTPAQAKMHLQRFVIANHHRRKDWSDAIVLLNQAALAPGQEIEVPAERLEEGDLFGLMQHIIRNEVAHALARKATSAKSTARFDFTVIGDGILVCV